MGTLYHPFFLITKNAVDIILSTYSGHTVFPDAKKRKTSSPKQSHQHYYGTRRTQRNHHLERGGDFSEDGKSVNANEMNSEPNDVNTITNNFKYENFENATLNYKKKV